MIKKYVIPLFLLLLLAVPIGGAIAAKDVLHGNPTTKIYHNSECKFYNCKKCTEVFRTEAAAKKAGYKACKVCGGDEDALDRHKGSSRK